MSTTQIGLGLAAIGRPEYINIKANQSMDQSENTYKKNAFSIFDFALKNNIKHFDTAASYGKGEQFLMDWYHTCKPENVNFSSKWGYYYVANWKIGFDGAHEIKEHSLKKLEEQWLFSKQLLPKLKLYQIHSATLESGVLENKPVLEKLYFLKKKYNIKIGISTSGENQSAIIERALNIKINETDLIDSFQVTFNILEQSTFKILEKIIGMGKQLLIKEALANGRLLPNKSYPKYSMVYNNLEELGQKYKVGIDAIALRFIMDYLNPSIVLSGALTKKQLNDNLKAYQVKLTSEEINDLKMYSTDSEIYWNERKDLQWN